MLTFLWPWVLLLSPLPLIYRYWRKPLDSRAPALRAGFYTRVAAHRGHAKGGKFAWLNAGLLAVVWLGVMLAAARPQWVGEPLSLPTSGRDLLLAVDISESMKTQDMAIDEQLYSRLDVVKEVVDDFVAHRTGDKLGLILFGSQAYLQVPLTSDRKTLGTLLQEARIGFAGSATAIGDAIGIAIKRLKERPAENRVLILLSDGADTASELPPLKAAQLAADHGIRIYTIGIGAEAVTRRNFFGMRTINPSMDLDEKALRQIAETTDGQYFRAKDPRELAEIYNTLDQLEPVDQEQEVVRPTRALFHWPLGVAFAAFLLVAVFRNRGAVHG